MHRARRDGRTCRFALGRNATGGLCPGGRAPCSGVRDDNGRGGIHERNHNGDREVCAERRTGDPHHSVFKGCNMACKWCHNPETLSVRPQLMIYPDKCIGCGACVEACRAGARTLGKTVPCSTIAPPASTAEPAPRTASPVLSSCPERR